MANFSGSRARFNANGQLAWRDPEAQPRAAESVRSANGLGRTLAPERTRSTQPSTMDMKIASILEDIRSESLDRKCAASGAALFAASEHTRSTPKRHGRSRGARATAAVTPSSAGTDALPTAERQAASAAPS